MKMRKLFLVAAAGLALVVSAGLSASAFTFSQRVLVYCPPSDTSGCETIVAALGNADRGYDGANGTVDLRSADLSSYAVLVIPSLADDGELKPYAFLRDSAVAQHLRQSVVGRRAFWSGTPDQGTANRESKNALLTRLAEWAGGNHVSVGAPGLLVLQDASTSGHYNWVSGLTGINVIADPAIRSYSAVRAVTATGTSIVADAAYSNMASRGFYLPQGAAGIRLDAVGHTGTSVGGQIVLITHPGAIEHQAVVATDKDDYAPFEAVTITGSGFVAGESVLLTLMEDPEVHEARAFSVIADSAGTFRFDQFAPEHHDIGVRFLLTASGQTSGRTAETTFTDSHVLEMVIMPANVPASSSGDYVLVINLRSNITVGRIAVTPEGSWSGVSITAGSTVASAGKSWSASYTGGQIILAAASATDRLTATAQSVSVRFTANANSSTGTKAWQAQGWSNLIATGTNHAIPDQKLNIGSNTKTATVGIAPSTVAGGSSNVHTVTITRTAGVELGSVGLALPAGYTITAMSAITAPAGKTWNGSFDAGTRFVRLIASADASRLTSNGQAISFTLTLTAPTGAATDNVRASAWKGFHFDDDPFSITTQPTIATTAAGPTKLAYTSSAHTGAVNACLGAIDFQTQNASSVATNVTSNTTVTLTTNGTGTFYSDDQCLSPITSVVVSSGSNSGTFYYKGTARGTGSHQLDIAASGLTGASQTQTINKLDQTITFDALADKLVTDADFAVSAVATSGLTVSFSSQTTGTCTVTGATVAIDAIGTCTIRASQAGDGNYNAAPTVDRSFEIGKAAGSVSINNIPGAGVALIGGSFDPAYTKAGDGTASTASLTTSICTVSSGTVSFIAAGQCDLQASVTEGTAHQAATGTTQSFTIGKPAGSVSINNIPGAGVALIGGSFDPAYTKAGDGTASTASLTTSICTVSSGTVSFIAAGQCDLQASVTEGTAHQAATGTTQSFTIGKPAGSVSINNIPGVGVVIVGGSFDPAYTKAGDGTASTASLTTSICTVSSGTVNFVAAGQCDLQASVTEGTAHQAATGTTQSFNIGPAPTQTSLGADPASPSQFGTSITFTATVTVGGSPVTTGNVKFIEGGTCASPTTTLQAAAAVNGSGVKTYVTSALGVGAHTIEACYEGTSNLGSSSDTEAYTITSVATATTVSGNPNPSVTGQSVTFTAEVTTNSGADAVQSGNVTFRLGGTDCTSGTVIGGPTSVNSSGEATTSRAFGASESGATIRACYSSGDSNVEPSNGTTTQTVNPAATSTSIGSNNNPSQFNQNVTFTATVSVTSPGAGTPTGNVSFYEFTGVQSCTSPGAAVALGTQAVAAGSAAITVSNLSVGTHPVTACYAGDTNFQTSGSSAVSQVVNPLTTSTALTVIPSSQQYSDSTVFTATVTPNEAGAEALTGNVHFYVGAGVQACGTSAPAGAVGTDALADADNGVGTFRYAIDKAAGAYTVTACFYSTNVAFASSTNSASLAVTAENATVYDINYSPNPLQVPTPAGTFTFKVRETNPETNDPNLTAAGNIGLAAAGVTLKGILNPSASHTLNCTAGPVSGSGYSAFVPYACVLPAGLAADTYEADITVNTNGYYTGGTSSVVQVTDPNAGFATGGGWFTMEGGDRVNFGFMAKATVNNKKTVYQGSLLVIRHTATGEVIKAKSNVFDGYSIKTITGGSAATFTGKANYSLDGLSTGNFVFTGYAEDKGTPGAGTDKFGLYLASAGNQVATSATLNNLVASARTLEGGNVQVPQPGRK